MKLAEKSDDLKTGAEALSQIGNSLDKMAALKFDGSEIKIEKFAEDLKNSVPIIEQAIMGSTEGLFFKTEIKGLASTEIKWAEAAKNIKMLRQALGSTVESDMGGAGSRGDSDTQKSFESDTGGPGDSQKSLYPTQIHKLNVNQLIAETLISRAVEKSATGAAGAANTFVTDASSNVSTSTTALVPGAVPFDHPSQKIGALVGAK